MFMYFLAPLQTSYNKLIEDLVVDILDIQF